MTTADGLRDYDPARERAIAHEILRRALLAGPLPYTVHPGEWDWWCYHADPRLPEPLRLIGSDVLAWLGSDGELSAFGTAVADTDLPDGPQPHGDRLAEVLLQVAARAGEGAVRSVGWVSHLDGRREGLLRAAGFGPAGSPMTVFTRPSAVPGVPVPPLPPGFAVRPLAGPQEAQGRADAARLAFASTMPAAQHRARYRRFMASPAYPPRRDLVVVTPDGEIAAFAIWWPDHELRLGQLEPVGTHPRWQGQGLGRAVVHACLAAMAAEGLDSARVCTEVHRTAAQALYRSCGFSAVDALRWWSRA